MNKLSIDIETYSGTPITAGVYRYVEDPDFEILLFGYSVDDSAVKVVDLASGETIPDDIIAALSNPAITKWAFNAQFERICLSRFLYNKTGKYLHPKGWKCTMTWAAILGLPFSLKQVGAVLNIDKKKLDEGKELIRYFCVPCKPTKKNGYRLRNYYYHDKEKWELFKFYNQRDVEAESSIQMRLSNYPVPEFVWEEYWMCELINDRGVLVDENLITNAIEINEICREKYLKTLQNLTNLENPNSVAQLKEWLFDNDVNAPSLGKKEVKELLTNASDETVQQVLLLRQMISKSSIKKYEAMLKSKCSDNRVRGMFQFYGANRTGRFSSKIVQLQNLPQNHLPDLASARALVKEGNINALEMLYPDVPDTLSQLIRTAFIPKPNHKFIVSDFSAIEARVIAWYAGEEWRMDAFKNNEDIYCASASQMFGVPVEKHGVNAELRPKGKIAELALGYGGAKGALIAMSALDYGLKEEELDGLVTAWRKANPNIVKFWWDVERAIKAALNNANNTVKLGQLEFEYKSKMLFITLPSGRKLAYVKPQIVDGSITYYGIDSKKKYTRIESYGPKFVENVIQATARDLLIFAMKNLSQFKIVAHVHDEVIIEGPMDTKVSNVVARMTRNPDWAAGLILNADGYECEFYQKD